MMIWLCLAVIYFVLRIYLCMYSFVYLLQVFPKLFNGAVKYDELYAWLVSLLTAGSQFDTARRQENKPITPVVRTQPTEQTEQTHEADVLCSVTCSL